MIALVEARRLSGSEAWAEANAARLRSGGRRTTCAELFVGFRRDCVHVGVVKMRRRRKISKASLLWSLRSLLASMRSPSLCILATSNAAGPAMLVSNDRSSPIARALTVIGLWLISAPQFRVPVSQHDCHEHLVFLLFPFVLPRLAAPSDPP